MFGNKTILFLDDAGYRHDKFQELLDVDLKIGCSPPEDVHFADKFVECLNVLLLWSPFDLILLDHDLQDFGTSDERTGYHVAYFIAHILPVNLRPKEVWVHSANPPGAERMVSELDRVGIPCKRVDLFNL